MVNYLALSYGLCVTAVVGFAAYAIIIYTVRLLRTHRDQTAVQFITARKSQPWWRIMFSFFATAVGSWCLVSPSQFAVYTGILGLAMYAFASGIPVLIVSLCGEPIRRMHPDVSSIADFAGKRFGPIMRTIVVLVCLLNMSIAMLAEYTVIGSLFKDFVGSVAYPMIIVVGVLTMIYTAYGGLLISILTDQLQAILTVIFIAILTIFVAATFREPLQEPLPESLGVTKYGYSAIFSMPCSLLAATVFSEAVWQKVWASADRRSVVLGGLGASVLIMCAVFLFGFGGWLAAWGNLIYWDYDSEGNPITNPNLFLFQVFQTADSNDGTGNQPAQVRSWIGVLSLVLAVTMNEGAIDSLQSGLTGTLVTHFFRDQHIVFTRSVVWVINIPLMIVALQDYPILSLYLIPNMLTSCCFLPVLSGIFERTRTLVTETTVVFGCCFAVLSVCMYGGGRWYNETVTPKGMPLNTRTAAFGYGIHYAWFDNVNYDYDYFLIASGTSVLGMAIWRASSWVVFRLTGWEGPGVSALFTRVPGYGFITGSGLGVDLLSKVTCGRYTYTKPADEDGELPTSSSQDGSDDIMHQGPTKDVALAGKEVDALQPPAKQVVV